MTTTTLKRNKKNIFDNIKPVNELDEIKDLDVNESNIKQILKDYEEALNEVPDKEKVRNWIDISEKYNSILSPKEIKIFAKIKITMCITRRYGMPVLRSDF